MTYATNNYKILIYRYQIEIAHCHRDHPGLPFPTTTYNHEGCKTLPSCIYTIVNRLKRIIVSLHPSVNKIKWVFIVSEANSARQTPHFDNVSIYEYRLKRVRTNIGQIPFSVLFDLQYDVVGNPSRLCFYNEVGHDLSCTVHTISPGGFTMFRGDVLHGGADYPVRNIRLFMGVGTFAFPWDDNAVHVVQRVVNTNTSINVIN